MVTLSDEDVKLCTLAKAARARIGAASGAAVRDELGRTYASASVDLPGLRLSGLELAVAQAVASGATGLEAAVIFGSAEDPGITPARVLGGPHLPVFCCADDGTVATVQP